MAGNEIPVYQKIIVGLLSILSGLFVWIWKKHEKGNEDRDTELEQKLKKKS